MGRKKREPDKPEKKPDDKPPDKLTTDEAITRLFPKPVLDTVRHALDPKKKRGD